MKRPFRVPFYPVIPVLSALACLYLMTNLSIETWLRFAIWMVIGVVLYLVYGTAQRPPRPARAGCHSLRNGKGPYAADSRPRHTGLWVFSGLRRRVRGSRGAPARARWPRTAP